MASMTAQILVGSPHPFHGGINPTHKIYLSENSRPALILTREDIHEQNINDAFDKATWIPTLENMLDDIFLMISYFLLKDESLSQELSKIKSKDLRFLEMYEDINEETRLKLYKSNKNIIGGYKDLKLVFSIFKGSSLSSDASKIKDYKIDFELCISK